MDRTTLVAVVGGDAGIRSWIGTLLTNAGLDAVLCKDGDVLDRVLERRAVDLVMVAPPQQQADVDAIRHRLVVRRLPVPMMLVPEAGPQPAPGRPTRAPAYQGATRREREAMAIASGQAHVRRAPEVVLAQARAILDRVGSVDAGPSAGQVRRYRFAGWKLDAVQRTLTRPDGGLVALTGGEYDMLVIFLRRPQRILSRALLLRWTRDRARGPDDRTMDVQLSRLRRKLGDEPRSPAMIRTVRRAGYLFAPEVQYDRD